MSTDNLTINKLQQKIIWQEKALQEIRDWCKSASYENGVELQYVLNIATAALEKTQ